MSVWVALPWLIFIPIAGMRHQWIDMSMISLGAILFGCKAVYDLCKIK